MKNLTQLTFFAFLALSLTLASCSEDTVPVKPTVDIREQIAGTYTYESTDWAEGEEHKDSGRMVIQKSTTSDGIVFLEYNEEFVKGNNLRSVTDGVAFDLEDDSISEDGILYELEGIDFIELGDAKYNGAYETTTNRVSIAFDVFVDGTRSYSSSYVMTKI